MKTIGLIGGMSWESTALYYQTINRAVARRLGGLHSARIHVVSLDFAEIVSRQQRGDWPGMADILREAARQLASSGADCVLIATNTMHRVAAEVQAATALPLLHIADVTAQAIKAAGLSRIGLLGTRYTMEQPFYVDRLAAHGVACVIPNDSERAEVHRIIFEELCKGELRDSSRRCLVDIVRSLQERGADGVVLGCTELPMILDADDVSVPVFDTTRLHAMAAVELALA